MRSPQSRRGYVQTSQGQLHYRRKGEGSPLLMLQILPFSTAMFEPLMAAMAPMGFDCLALDLMGYGQSDRRGGMWTVEDHARTLDEALLVLGFRPGGVISGHFTAMVASEFAVTHPERLDCLVLDGVPLWPRDVARQRLAAPAPAPVWAEDGAAIRDLWSSATGLMRKFDPDLVLNAETTPLAAEAFFGVARTVLAPGSTEAIFRYDLESRLPSITTPTLVIASPTDSLRDRHDAAMALIPGATQHIFATVHPLYALGRPERAGAYAAVVSEFLRR